MNTEADVIEAQLGKRVMSRCHGFWSLGSMVGAVIGSVFAHADIDLHVHFALVFPLCAVIGYGFATLLPPDMPTSSRGSLAADLPSDASSHAAAVDEAVPLFRLPAPGILALCAMPLGIMLVEGAFIDWSAVFMRSVLDATPLVIGTAYAFFSIVMAIVRLSGDAIAARFGDLAVVRVSALAATGGVAMFALAPNVLMAFVGAAFAGAGVAIVYPLAISAAARRSGRSAADNVAAVTMIGFSAFLLGPPLIGFVADALSLRMAVLLLAPLAFTTFLLSGEVSRQPRDA